MKGFGEEGCVTCILRAGENEGEDYVAETRGAFKAFF